MVGDAARIWATLDEAWLVAFGQAWEALRSGNIAVGACAATPDGEIAHAARNRVVDVAGPPGEVFGSSLAHAEMNVLARLPFRGRRDLILTTTLQPCLQCAAAIRFGRIAQVRFAGADRFWDGCHDFGRLNVREAGRFQPSRVGPFDDELGIFATLISRFGPTLETALEDALRAIGEGPMIDLVHELEADGTAARLAAMEVGEAFGYLWPHLTKLSPSWNSLARSQRAVWLPWRDHLSLWPPERNYSAFAKERELNACTSRPPETVRAGSPAPRGLDFPIQYHDRRYVGHSWLLTERPLRAASMTWHTFSTHETGH